MGNSLFLIFEKCWISLQWNRDEVNTSWPAAKSIDFVYFHLIQRNTMLDLIFLGFTFRALVVSAQNMWKLEPLNKGGQDPHSPISSWLYLLKQTDVYGCSGLNWCNKLSLTDYSLITHFLCVFRSFLMNSPYSSEVLTLSENNPDVVEFIIYKVI
jgi:hypothetical protein